MKGKGPILVVDDEEIVRESLSGWLREDGYQVDAVPDGVTALRKLKERVYAVLLVDLKMPGMDGLEVLVAARNIRSEAAIILMTAYATVDTAVQAMKNGAYDYLVKPFEPEELSRLVGHLIQEQALRQENVELRKALECRFSLKDIVGRSPMMATVFEMTRAAAQSHSTVLLLGESGTGKELLARAIHSESPRKDGPFVCVSCAALAENLLESELFGHEKGAFTGAVATRRGKFELAQSGTLFLDEIGDVSPKLQADLLRVLEVREFHRVGGSHLIKIDARVIAATHRDLKEMVKGGVFREDLYYRLNVIPIRIPPLRERKEDIPLLVEHLLATLRAQMGKPLADVSPEALALLTTYDWPGNVRELRNVLERGAVMTQDPILTPVDLDLTIPLSAGPENGESAGSLRDAERRHIMASLEQHNWNITRTAKVLGIDRVTLYNKIKRYRIREAE